MLLLFLLLTLSGVADAISSLRCTVSGDSGASSSFPVVSNGVSTSIIVSAEDWEGVHLAVSDFASDIERVTGIRPEVATEANSSSSTTAIIVGTLGKSPILSQVSGFDTSSIEGEWEAFMSGMVDAPLPGIDQAYVIAGSDKRGTIYALYEHSEQFGVSPWYWWADVPTQHRVELHVPASGCSHGPPTVQFRGIFLNDEQPGLQSWAMEKFTNGTGSAATGSPFNHNFYVKVFELLLRLKGNYLWPAMWGSAFGVDDSENQRLANIYGIAMGTSHQEPMARASPPEWDLFGNGPWNYTSNTQAIYDFWVDGVERAKEYETVYTLGMRGAGDLPLDETTNIRLLEQVIADQREILASAYGNVSIETVPQVWALYKEVEGYYEDGLRVPDDVTLLWADDNWGNVRRFPVESERNRSGGAGVYYHVGSPRNYKWITTVQLSKVYDQMSLAVERNATRLWIVNIGDLKPYEREIEFFLNYGWDAPAWNADNIDDFVTSWAKRDFAMSTDDALAVTEIVANLTRFNGRRSPELLTPTTYSLLNYREADRIMASWDTLVEASTAIYDNLSDESKPAFFELVQHPVSAGANLGKMMVYAGLNAIRASQARMSTNALADQVEELFEHDYDLESEYHSLLDGKWNHMMDQTHLGYYYWQQPMMNSMPTVTRVHSRKQALSGALRVIPEGTLGAWPGDNPNQYSLGYNCLPPCVLIDSFDVFGDRYIDVGSGGPASFTFSVSTNVTWLSITPSEGEISTENPEQRVYASVNDWDALSQGDSYAILTIRSSQNQSVSVSFVARNTNLALPSSFSGFVESMGVVSIEATHASRNNSVDDTYWKELPGIGRTLSGVTPWPRTDTNYTAGRGPSLEYDLFTFTFAVNATANIYVSPSLNANSRDQPLGVAFQLDSQAITSSYFIPLSAPGSLPAVWEGFVANATVQIPVQLKNVSAGTHVFKVYMIEPAVVVQKIVIDVGGLKPSHLGPPESVIIV